jgi:hypothetical protein
MEDFVMTRDNTSLAEQWRRSPTAQGVALGLVLGPVGMLLAYLLSAKNKRIVRLLGALKGSLVAATSMVVIGVIVVVAIGV